VAAYSALWSPNTGIVDYGLVSKSLACDIVETGRGDVKLAFQVQSFERDEATGDVLIRGVEPGQPGPGKAVTAKCAITCAGFHSDKVARLAGAGSFFKSVHRDSHRERLADST
jgi:2-hydroxyglutarate dehydrogenase